VTRISPWVCCLLLFSKILDQSAYVLPALFPKPHDHIHMRVLLDSSLERSCHLRMTVFSVVLDPKRHNNCDMSQTQWKLLFQNRQQPSHVSFWFPCRNHVEVEKRLFKSFAQCTHECGRLCPLLHLRKRGRFFSWFCWSPLVGRTRYINLTGGGHFPSCNTLLLLFVEPKR